MEERHESEDIIIRAVEILGVMYLLGWFFKKMIRRPYASLVMTGSVVLACYSAYWFNHDWEFWPVFIMFCFSFARVVNR